MNFFAKILGQTIQPQQTDEYKMKYAPLTNQHQQQQRGSTSIATHSKKNATNRFLLHSSFTEISEKKMKAEMLFLCYSREADKVQIYELIFFHLKYTIKTKITPL